MRTYVGGCVRAGAYNLILIFASYYYPQPRVVFTGCRGKLHRGETAGAAPEGAVLTTICSTQSTSVFVEVRERRRRRETD